MHAATKTTKRVATRSAGSAVVGSRVRAHYSISNAWDTERTSRTNRTSVTNAHATERPYTTRTHAHTRADFVCVLGTHARERIAIVGSCTRPYRRNCAKYVRCMCTVDITDIRTSSYGFLTPWMPFGVHNDPFVCKSYTMSNWRCVRAYAAADDDDDDKRKCARPVCAYMMVLVMPVTWAPAIANKQTINPANLSGYAVAGVRFPCRGSRFAQRRRVVAAAGLLCTHVEQCAFAYGVIGAIGHARVARESLTLAAPPTIN